MTGGRPFLVFIHGWGFDATIWDDLQVRLPDHDQAVFDLGYFGDAVAPHLPSDRPLIAVTHSFGTLWLLRQRPFVWSGLVAINGFARFTEASDHRPAVAPRLLDRMIRQFDATPATVVGAFRRRCGCAGEPPTGLRTEPLRRDLLALRDGDGRAVLAQQAAPTLALAGTADSIVEPGMAEHALAAASDLTVQWLPDGGHLLPSTAPDWCAEQVRSFTAGHAARP